MSTEDALAAMKAYIDAFPSNLETAREIGSTQIENFKVVPVSNVLIAGLGGSGIGGKVIAQTVSAEATCPILSLHDYTLPAWVGPSTLFVACSYSGNTEETITAVQAAHKAGASIACITSGGKLKALANKHGWNCIEIPGGQPPRTSFGFNAHQLFYVLQAYGIVGDRYHGEIKSGAEFLKREADSIHSLAKEIATKLNSGIPVLYGATQTEGVLVRFRQQINENAKMLCWHHVLPEMNHNELVGWASGSDDFVALFVESEDDHPSTSRRMALTRDIIQKKTAHTLTVKAHGDSLYVRSIYLIHLFDWASYYLAELRNADPIEIDVIDYLKNELAKS